MGQKQTDRFLDGWTVLPVAKKQLVCQ